MLENANAPTQVADLVSSLVSELKDTTANTNMANNVHYMAAFVENDLSVMPSAFDDIEIGQSVAADTSTEASENSSSLEEKSNGDNDADSSTAARMTTGMLVLSMSTAGVMAMLL
ncbi:hypothetical protein IWW56_002713 [Coemansia sp. RSA 2131]|nr:hypothetical protein IWW56_002713 [Coemansia sp. RSA 2131]